MTSTVAQTRREDFETRVRHAARSHVLSEAVRGEKHTPSFAVPIRLQADADFNQIIVSAVARRYPEIDFRTATAAGLAGLKDAEVLAVAGRDGRVLVTHDHATMPKYFGEFIRTTPSPGLIVVPQSLAVREVVDGLILIWAATQPEEWVNRIVYLPI